MKKTKNENWEHPKYLGDWTVYDFKKSRSYTQSLEAFEILLIELRNSLIVINVIPDNINHWTEDWEIGETDEIGIIYDEDKMILNEDQCRQLNADFYHDLDMIIQIQLIMKQQLENGHYEDIVAPLSPNVVKEVYKQIKIEDLFKFNKEKDK